MYSLRSTGSLELMDEDTIIRYGKLVEFEDTFRNPADHNPLSNKLHQAIVKKISSCDIKMSLLRMFPIWETLRTYRMKDLPNDIIAGITSGVMMIPQGMAFASLSTLPPIVGLYISFFASITYFFLGTGRQLSWGCIAVLSLMMANILDRYDRTLTGDTPFDYINNIEQGVTTAVHNNSVELNITFHLSSVSNISNVTTEFDKLNEDKLAGRAAKRLEVASAVSFVAGLIFVIASRLGLSRVTSIMSNSLITGFTVGISFHVVTSQLKTMFGISTSRYTGLGAVIRTWISVFKNLPKTNVATLIISIISILVLYFVKKCINDRYKKKMRIPVPVELLVVIVATLISNFANLHHHFNVKVVETVPIGVPAPKFPDLFLVTDYIGDAIIIIVIAYAQTLAMAKTMGLKNNYVVDPNQEMLACGMCSVVCGLFSGYICAASVSRSVVQDGAGGKTQVASLVAACLVLLVIMLIGPYFYYLPMCVLSAIIVVNLRTMFLKLLEIPREWRKSKYDCAVWVFACVSCIVLNVDIGLLTGVIFSLFLIVLRAMLTPVVEVGQIRTSSHTVELRSLDKYSSAEKLQNVLIIKIKTPLYFVNAETFTSKVFSKTGIDPVRTKKHVQEMTVNNHTEQGPTTTRPDTGECFDKMLSNYTHVPLKTLLLDASEMAFIDLMGVQALQFLIEEFSSVDVEVLVTSIPESIIPILKSTGFWAKHGERLFLSVESALSSIVTAVPSLDAVSVQDDQVHQKTNL